MLPGSALADCNANRYSDCFSADSLWVDPFPGPGLSTTSAGQHPETAHLGMLMSYHYEPLSAVLASADPYGTEVPVLEHWWTAQLFASTALWGLDLGVTLPLAFGSVGAGTTALRTRNAESSAAGFGDPRVSARLARSTAIGDLAVIQELSLPFGQESSLLTSPSITYAPRLSIGWHGERAQGVLEAGVRLREAARFGSIRFGSEATLAAAFHYGFGGGFAGFAEAWSTPALTRSESQWSDGRSEVRRTPAELMFGAAWDRAGLRGALGLGTSLPLSSEETTTGTETFAGPPGPSLRTSFQLEASW
jgi:hypothetical protein